MKRLLSFALVPLSVALIAGCALRPGDPEYSYCPQRMLPEPSQKYWIDPQAVSQRFARASAALAAVNRPPGPPQAVSSNPPRAYTGPWWIYQTTQGTTTTTIRRNGAQWTDGQRQYYQTPTGDLRDASGNIYRLRPDGSWRR